MYKFKKDGMNVPAFIWQQEGAIEDSAIEQVVTMASLPFSYHHVVLCPDGHMGYGMPIGGILATEGVVVPNAVGVDIGCGMLAVKTSLHSMSQPLLKSIMGEIRETVPVGFSKHQKQQDRELMPILKESANKGYPIVGREFESALYQLGTLGGGNHFIEIQEGDDEHVWFMIHSGSRGFGFKIAKHYNDLAKELNKKWFTSIPKEHDLAFLPLDSDEGKAYIREMNYAMEYAQANRDLMAMRVIEAFVKNSREDCIFHHPINIHHNYARMENHFNRNVMVHRKGATSAKSGELGIIPGSQGTHSYIVGGKGNPQSFCSCSHGAGRKMGRKAAQRDLVLNDEIEKLNALGVVHSVRNIKDLDEAPGAYKDINLVMEEQQDLVEVMVKLTPLGVIKG